MSTRPSGEEGRAAVYPVAPLAGLAAAAAWLDLVGRRGALRTIKELVTQNTLLSLDGAGRTIANVAALCCFVVLAFELVQMLRAPDEVSSHRKWILGTTFALFLPSALAATFLPTDVTSPKLVLLGSVTAHVFAMQILAESVPARNRPGTRLFALMVIAATLFGFVSLAASILGPVYQWPRADLVAAASRDVGELAFLLGPLALAFEAVGRDGRELGRVRVAFAFCIALIAMGGFREARLLLGSSYEIVLYGALRLGAFGVSPSWPYAVVIGLALFAGIYAATSTRDADRRLGLGLLLFFAAGFSPRAIGPLLMMVTGAALVSRGAIAGEREAVDAS